MQHKVEYLEERDLKDSHAFSRMVLESSPDCLKILDIEGKLQYMNFNGLCKMEIDDFGVLKNKNWWDLWGKENEEMVKSSVDKALKGEANQFSAFCATAKGTPKWWEVTVTPVRSDSAVIYQLLSISRDITEQKQREQQIKDLNASLEEKIKLRTEELLAKNEELQKTNEELVAFNHIATHDLQEPLRKIQMFSNLILESDTHIKETHYNFSRIISATQRMRSLIDSLHLFSTTRNNSILPEQCDLNVIVNQIMENLQEQIDQKKAKIEFSSLPSLTGSNILITQLFTNLIENALKYSREEISPIIKINYKIVPREELEIQGNSKSENFYSIEIQDNGIGFEENYKNKIFELFQRLHQKNEYSGTGVGLTICKTIVKKHNGWIDASGIPNVGSKFVIYVPERLKK